MEMAGYTMRVRLVLSANIVRKGLNLCSASPPFVVPAAVVGMPLIDDRLWRLTLICSFFQTLPHNHHPPGDTLANVSS